MIAVEHRARTVAVALAMVVLLFGARTVAAQGTCTIEHIAGTYTFETHGSSTFVLGPGPFPRHWSLTSAPFVMVGWITLQPDSTMSGRAWVILGSMTSGLDAGLFEGHLVLDETTCTAILDWKGTFVPGTPPAPHSERLVFVHNGRGFRSMLIQSPSGTMAWIGRGYRIPQVSEYAAGCRPQFARGDLLLQCEALNSGTSDVPASASMLYRLRVARDGSFTGTSYVKDPSYSEGLVEGAFDVQPNCTVEARLLSPSVPDMVQYGRGVIFDEGKNGFLILPLLTTSSEGTSVPVFARCEWLSLGR